MGKANGGEEDAAEPASSSEQVGVSALVEHISSPSSASAVRVLSDPELFLVIASFQYGRAFKNWYSIDAAAALGYRELVVYLHSRQEPMRCTASALYSAATHGDLELVQLLIGRFDQSYFAEVAAYAAEHGHGTIVRWLCEKAPLCCTSHAVIEKVATFGDLDLLTWLYTRRKEAVLPPKTCRNAAVKGHLHILQWVREYAPSAWYPRITLVHAAAHNQRAIVYWLHETGDVEGPNPPEVWDRWLHLWELGKFEVLQALNQVAKAGQLSVLQLLLEHYVDLQAEASTMSEHLIKILESAASGGSLEVFNYLNDFFSTRLGMSLPSKQFSSIMDAAAHEGHLHVMEWLYEHQGARCSPQALNAPHVQVLQWLFEKQWFSSTDWWNALESAAGCLDGKQRDVLIWILSRKEELLGSSSGVAAVSDVWRFLLSLNKKVKGAASSEDFDLLKCLLLPDVQVIWNLNSFSSSPVGISGRCRELLRIRYDGQYSLEILQLLYEHKVVTFDQDSLASLFITKRPLNEVVAITRFLEDKVPGGFTPDALYQAARWSSSLGHLKFVLAELRHRGHTDIMPPEDDKAICNAAERGHADIVEYLVDLGSLVTQDSISAAIRGDHFHIAQYLHSHGASPKAGDMWWPAARGDLRFCRWLHEQCQVELRAKSFIAAAGHGNLHILEHFHDLGQPKVLVPKQIRRAVREALDEWHVVVVDWILEKYSSSSLQNFYDDELLARRRELSAIYGEWGPDSTTSGEMRWTDLANYPLKEMAEERLVATKRPDFVRS